MSERRLAVPRGVGVQASEVASGQRPIAQPRDAATVVLVRPGQAGLEVLMLARARAMDFAPGAHVFPGGSVDPQDAGVPCRGSAPGGLGVPDERARALVCAAVRETFEESGVLIGVSAESGGSSDSGPGPEDRRALLAGEVSFGEILARHGLVLTPGLVTPWARWVTPEAAPRRFDTWFFVAEMPPGQIPEASAESDSVEWLRPDDALAAARAGRLTLLPPTAVTLAEIGGHTDVATVIAARREIVPLMPTVDVEGGTAWLTLPAGTEYPL
jgi:8-oxo-dGTP pyrophosphatase MutT (NUDIX family)